MQDFIKKVSIFSVIAMTIGLSFFVNTQKASAGILAEKIIPDQKWYLTYARAVDIDSDGNIYVGSFGSVYIFNSSGTFLRRIYSYYNGGNQYFCNIAGIHVDSSKSIFVTDECTGMVTKLSSSGRFQFSISGLAYPQETTVLSNGNIAIAETGLSRVSVYNYSGNVLLYTFGSFGTGNGQFDAPRGIDVDSNDNIFVSDPPNNRIQKFDKFGNYISTIGQGTFAFISDVTVNSDDNIVMVDAWANEVKIFDTNGNLLDQFGEGGIQVGQLNNCEAIATQSNNRIALACINTSKVAVIDGDGDAIFDIGASGDGNAKFRGPMDLSIDASEDIYVADSGNRRIQKFNSNMEYITQWSAVDGIDTEFDPSSVVVGPSGNIYVTDVTNHRVQVFTNNGTFVSKFGEYGTGNGQFVEPADLAFDSSNNIYVVERGNHRVQKFNSSGVYISQWGSMGAGNTELQYPTGISVQGSYVYVADFDNHRIQKYDLSGNYVDTIGGTARPDDEQSRNPTDVFVTTDGNIYLTSWGWDNVMVYDEDDNFITSWGGLGNTTSNFAIPNGIYVKEGATPEYFVADTFSNRISKFKNLNQIFNLQNGQDATDLELGESVKAEVSQSGVYGSDRDIRVSNDGLIIAESVVDMTIDRDWSLVTTDVDEQKGISVLSGLNPIDAPGAAATHSLFVPRINGQQKLHICPNANTLEEVTINCVGGYDLDVTDPSVTSVEGGTYRRIDGLTGTGALGLSITGTTFTLTPNSSAASATQEVVASYVTPLSFVAGDKVQVIFENAAGLALANTCITPTTDANGDSNADGSAAIVGANIYEYTFSDTVGIGVLNFCINVTGYDNQGSYSVVLNDDNGVYGSAMYYIEDDNDVFVIANVMPTLSFNIRTLADDTDTNVCDFGTVSSSTAIPNYDLVDDGNQECGYSLAIGTNASAGFTLQIQSDGALSSATDSIANIANAGVFTAGIEAYGLANVTAATTGRDTVNGFYVTPLDRLGNYNLATDTATFVPVAAENMLSHESGVEYRAGLGSSDVTKVMHGIVVGSGTPAGYYDQVVTYTVTGNF